ncbi:MAG: hypothetical protein GXP55_07035, partial [Deltaproteobacteria bacterium]|nr:hypothetical protein [Deltaproteobacteria bacterium]
MRLGHHPASIALWTCSLAMACTGGPCEGDTARSSPAAPPVPKAEDTAATEHEGQWTTLDPPAAAGALGASLTASADGVLATWIESRGEDAHAVRFATLRGEAWSDATDVVEARDLIANWADFPRSTLGGDGAIYVHYLRRAGSAAYAYEIQLMRKPAGARGFEALGVVHHDGTPTEHGFVSMLPDPEGVRLFWLDGRASVDDGPTAVYTSRVGERVGDEMRVDDKTCDCCQTDAALTRDGPLVVYRDRAEGEIRDIAIARWTGDGFSAPKRVHRDEWEMAGCPVNGPAVAADGARVAVAWFTGADGGSTRLAFSDDAGETFDAPIMIDAAQPLGRVDLALLEGGAAVSWLARNADEAELRVRFAHRDGRLGAASVVAETASARASGFPVLARDGARLLLAYRDGA